MRILALLVIFLPSFAFGQLISPQDIDFEFINQDKSAVNKNSRLELGVTLPDSILALIQLYMDGTPHQRAGLNPFVSWDINIKAHFKHKETGAKFSAIGFWFTDIKRNQAANSWDQIKTDQQFRIRYAPKTTGAHQVFLTVSIKGQVAFISDALDFNVVASHFKGFVSLNDSTKYFERDGKTIIPTGVNLPFPSNKNNLMYSLDENEKLDLSAWASYREMVQDYVKSGGEYFRMLMHPSAFDIEFEEVGYYQDRQYQAWEMDQILALCEENNTLIQFNLMYHSYFMKLGDYHQFRYDYTSNWADPNAWPKKDSNPPSGYSLMLNSKTPSDMFLKEEGMRYLKERARYIMARWGYSTSISAVELLCEPWHIDENPHENDSPYDAVSKSGDMARKAVYEYHKKMASYIKDSIQYNQHLLGGVGRFPVGKTAIYSHYTDESPDFIDSTWYLDDLDFISISYYSRSPAKLIHSKSSANNKFGEEENSMANTINRLRKTYNKPVLFGESDHGDGTHQCSDYQGHKIDVMRYPFTGAVGHFVWATYIVEEDEKGIIYRDQRVSWSDIIAAKEYYNTDSFLEIISNKSAIGRQKRGFGSSEKDIVEHQYVVGENQEMAAGYVYNRTFNIQTVGADGKEFLKENLCDQIELNFNVPTDISWKPQRMKVEGLKSFTNYRILFFSYSDQSLLIETELRSSLFGKLKLTHPLLIPKKTGTPLLWYRIEKLN